MNVAKSKDKKGWRKALRRMLSPPRPTTQENVSHLTRLSQRMNAEKTSVIFFED